MRTETGRTLAIFWDWSLDQLLVAAYRFDEVAQGVAWERKDDSGGGDFDPFTDDGSEGEGDGSGGGGDGSGSSGGHYDPNEPRVPAGNPDGGQWTSGGGVLQDADGNDIIDPNTGEPYPLPSSMDIWKNIEEGQDATALDMYNWFSHFGKMDYQRSSGIFDGSLRNVTNYNYGVVSAAAGYPLSHALFFAGQYNISIGRIHGGETGYGILPDAVANISQGWHDYSAIWNR